MWNARLNLAHCGLGILLACSGCAHLRDGWTGISGKSANNVSFAHQSAGKELPARKAADVCFATAQQLDAAGKTREAIQQYERARDYRPDLAEATHRLAILYDQAGDVRRAEEEFRAAAQTLPKHADLFNDWGFFLASQQRWPEAEEAYRRALSIEASHARATTNLALALAAQGQFGDAFLLFERVSGTAAAHSNIGVLLAQQGNEQEARKAFQQALALEPRHHHAQQFLTAMDSGVESGGRTQVIPVSYHQLNPP